MSTKVPTPSNGDDDEEDDGEDEVVKAAAQLEPIFKPARGRKAEVAKEA